MGTPHRLALVRNLAQDSAKGQECTNLARQIDLVDLPWINPTEVRRGRGIELRVDL
jgi:hypothetical protein